MVANLGRALTTLILALMASTSAFADDAVAERIIATYSALESYCDTVTVKDFLLDAELRRCYTRDGRYKRSEQLPPPASQRRLVWGDDLLSYTWYTHAQAGTTLYMEGPARSSTTGGLPDGLTARALHPFLRFVENERDVRKILREMEIVEEGPDTMILQRQYKNSGSGTYAINRLWVRRSDGLVTRGEELHGQISWSATLVDARINAPLSQADLSETAPFFRRFFHRYNLQTRPVEFVSSMAAVAFIIGLVLSIAWSRPRRWGRLWIFYAKGIGVMIAVLAALTVICVIPGFSGGHPPTIFMVFILGVFAGIGGLVIAALMLAMQLIDLARAAFR